MASVVAFFVFFVVCGHTFAFPCKYGNVDSNTTRSRTRPDISYYMRDPVRYQMYLNLTKANDDPDTKTFEPFDNCDPSQEFPLQCQMCDKCMQECNDAGYGFACCYYSSGGDQHRACCCYKTPGYCDVNPRCAITVCNSCF